MAGKGWKYILRSNNKFEIDQMIIRRFNPTLNDSSRDAGSGVDSEFEFRFFTVVDRKAFHKKRSKSGSSTTAKWMEDEKALRAKKSYIRDLDWFAQLNFIISYLKTGTIFRKTTNPIKYGVDEFFTNSIVPTSVVICSIFLTINQLLGMIKFTMSSSFEMFFISNY